MDLQYIKNSASANNVSEIKSITSTCYDLTFLSSYHYKKYINFENVNKDPYKLIYYTVKHELFTDTFFSWSDNTFN